MRFIKQGKTFERCSARKIMEIVIHYTSKVLLRTLKTVKITLNLEELHEQPKNCAR